MAQGDAVTNLSIITATISNPIAAPTLTTATTGGALPAATYFVKYTWVNANGETMVSPENSIATTGTTSTVNVTIPVLPTGTTSSNVYISTATNMETRQGSTTTTTYNQSSSLVTGVAMPTTNTAVTGILDIKPGVGSEWVIHNVLYNGGPIELWKTDGTNPLRYDTDNVAGGRFNVSLHCTNAVWYQIRNVSSAAVLGSYDGMQTK